MDTKLNSSSEFRKNTIKSAVMVAVLYLLIPVIVIAVTLVRSPRLAVEASPLLPKGSVLGASISAENGTDEVIEVEHTDAIARHFMVNTVTVKIDDTSHSMITRSVNIREFIDFLLLNTELDIDPRR